MGADEGDSQRTLPSGLSHEESADLLYAYAYETLMGGTPEARYPQVAAHLAECASCRADLEEMLEVTEEAVMASDTPVSPYRPDLSRLPRPWQQKTEGDRPWFIDRLGRLWIEFSEELLSGWRASPLVGAARGNLLYRYDSEQQEVNSAGLEATREEPALKVEIVVEQATAMAQVCVEVDLPGRNALNQSGIPVALYVGEHVREDRTDATGSVYFPDVPRDTLASLRLEIKVVQSA